MARTQFTIWVVLVKVEDRIEKYHFWNLADVETSVRLTYSR
jgi:hypothetical protein